MFCYQCEQTAKGTGCSAHGVCGKDPETAALQDLLNHAVKGISQYAALARGLGAIDRDVDVFVLEALFTTVTNVNFDPDRLAKLIRQAAAVRDQAKRLYEDACAKAGKTPERPEGPATWEPAETLDDLVSQGELVTIENEINEDGPEIAGVRQLIFYGLKGAAAYADHAHVLGRDDDAIYADFHEILSFLADNPVDVDSLLGMALRTGELNFKVMELLDAANTGAYGNPEPTAVRITPVKGKAILISGHDLKDLKTLLEQTEGKGINVYTHGEMLPAHGYPELKKHKHLVGNYGGAWQDQRREFEAFPGAILMTTNCIQKPKDTYKARIFTSGLVAWPGVDHIDNGDFFPVIEAALAADGFAEDGEDKTIMVGFGHNAVTSVAGQVVEGVKAGAIKHFFLIGGCDGAKTGRNYYTELAEKVPDDCVILTLACGKYRFNKLDFGDIPLRDKATGDTVGGIPRLLDCGQCNDAYSAIKIALALSDAFGVGVNELPLSMVLSWYEQKAVAILLTLLHLGVKNIRLGPSLPAFLSPKVVEILVDKFQIAPTTTPEGDLKAILGA